MTRGVLEVVIEFEKNRRLIDQMNFAGAPETYLPISSNSFLPPIPVGATPLLPVPELRKSLGLKHLWIKDDTRNPSGSTKDRASFLVVAKAMEYGFDTVATASTGNAATALAAVSAAAGIKSVVLVPKSAPPAKLVQMMNYGARLIPVDGSYDQAFDLSLKACEKFGWCNRNTAYNPFTIEGKKTAALEIVADMSPDAPDVVFIPTGDGVILAGLAKGFADMIKTGALARQPRLIAVQPEKSSSIVRALKAGAKNDIPVGNGDSIADSLNVKAPRNALVCLKRIRESGGTGVEVSDDAILDAIGMMAQKTGVFAEPAGAAAMAGFLVAREQNLVDPKERCVLLVTGTGLKDIQAASIRRAVPKAIRPGLDELEQAIKKYNE